MTLCSMAVPVVCQRMFSGVCKLLPTLGTRCSWTEYATSTVQSRRLQSTSLDPGYVPKTSLSSPPWPQIKLPDPREEAVQHAELVQRVNNLIANGQFGRLFAVIQFASRQWKVTNEDLISTRGIFDAECGDRIRLEKVLLVGSDDFTLIGKPLLGKDLVRIEATVIEKTECCPRVLMRFWKRHRYQRKKIIVYPETVLRINTIELAPRLS